MSERYSVGDAESQSPHSSGGDLPSAADNNAMADDELSGLLEAGLVALERNDIEFIKELLCSVSARTPASLDLLIDCAELYARAHLDCESDRLFEELIELYPGNRRLHFLYGKRLYFRGILSKAERVFEGADPFAEGSNPENFIDHAISIMEVLEEREGRSITDDDDCRLLALKHAILSFASRPIEATEGNCVGRIAFVTGGLGAGGAERQLSRTAARLEEARTKVGAKGEIRLGGQVEVLVRTHSGKAERAFYLPELVNAGVEVTEIDRMPAARPADFDLADPDLKLLLEYLPRKAEFGTLRLTPHFIQTRPEVVSLWQDGSCLLAVLAALIAGVPRIQVVIRGLPPIIRTHLFNSYYEEMYRALAAVPGVSFVSNSKAAAAAYSTWLDIPLHRFSILYNGVAEMEVSSTPKLDDMWDSFCQRTEGATQTIGSVFRFDVDKRPKTWIRFAIRHLANEPNCRFVLVGDGRLFDDTMAFAKSEGIADRILFVGQSNNVGFWMSKLDVLVLMSSFEGLPNVLIEAQFLGVPVVSTPAGGANECFVEGVSGHILSCADKTDLQEASLKVSNMVGRARKAEVFDAVRNEFLQPNFSVENMVENFARLAANA